MVPFILLKTQHRYATVREFALKTLATLILEDYLKFRGALLIYVLAAMLDSQREIKELAIELIMKYTLEKNELFLRTCLLECPFVFNMMPCFGQTLANVSKSGNILKGKEKKSARELIYRYMIRKVDSVHLYMYLGNITRLLDHIEKERELLTLPDMQAAIVDFLYVCAEICIANEKEKKNFAKCSKDNQDGADDGEVALTSNEGVSEEDTSTKKGRRGKKNVPTITQALAVVEKIVPQIVSIDEKLKAINSNVFGPVLDRLCTEMCGHFEQIFEYAQPQSFWAKYKKGEKRPIVTASTSRQSKKHSAARKVDEAPAAVLPTRSRKVEENDSGQFTMEDESLSRKSDQTQSMSARSGQSKHKKHAGSDYDSDSGSDARSESSRYSRRSKSRTPCSSKRKSIETPSSRKSARHR